MIDVNEIVEPILAGVGPPVCYQYPERFNSLPVISFYSLSDTAGFQADNQEWAQKARVQVDIWADRAADAGRVGVEVDRVMQAEGWTRELAADLPKQTDDRIYHRTMRFAKEIYYNKNYTI